MKFTKIRDVKTPTGNRGQDAGLDFYIPNDWNEGQPYYLSIGEQVNIPSGIKVNIPEGYMLKIDNKSGVALKKGLLIGATIIDHSYRGEIHINLFKPTSGIEDLCSMSENHVFNSMTMLKPGEKIAQGILIKISDEEIEEITNEDYENLPATARGEGRFGSTGVI